MKLLAYTIILGCVCVKQLSYENKTIFFFKVATTSAFRSKRWKGTLISIYNRYSI